MPRNRCLTWRKRHLRLALPEPPGPDELELSRSGAGLSGCIFGLRFTWCGEIEGALRVPPT